MGVKVKVNECIAKVEFNGIQYFFLAEIIDGSFGTGQGEEYTDENRNRGTYQPMWVDIERLLLIDVRPKEIAKMIHYILN